MLLDLAMRVPPIIVLVEKLPIDVCFELIGQFVEASVELWQPQLRLREVRKLVA